MNTVEKQWIENMEKIGAAINERDRLAVSNKELVSQLKALRRAYVGLLETGRDRIIGSGGSCDSVEIMEAASPILRECLAALKRAKP